jgi:hypothetical protein
LQDDYARAYMYHSVRGLLCERALALAAESRVDVWIGEDSSLFYVSPLELLLVRQGLPVPV